jgi:hypothetical protein
LKLYLRLALALHLLVYAHSYKPQIGVDQAQVRAKAQKVYDGAKKRMILIQDQLDVLFTQKTLKQKAESTKSVSKGKVKSDSTKIKSNKTKLKAGLKKIIKTIGPLAIVIVFGKVLNIYVTRLANTVSQLSALVDKTNDTIRAATTKSDIQKAKISRNAALDALASAESQVENFRNTLTTANRIITILTLLLSIVAALPTVPYQLSPLAIKTTRIIAKFTPVLISLNVLIQVSQATLESFITTIAYERSRLLPLNDILEQADANNLSPEEVRNLLDTLIESNSNSSNGLGPVMGVEYNGFTFSILEEDDPKYVVAGNKRRYAVALDRSGFIVLHSTPSFTLDPNVLIEELKLEIDKQNLEA